MNVSVVGVSGHISGVCSGNKFIGIQQYVRGDYYESHEKRAPEALARGLLILNVPGEYRKLASAVDRCFGFWPGKNKNFTGRVEDLEALASHLHDSGAASGVLGLGGAGKTQLAAEYFNQTLERKEYALQVWLRGSDIDIFSMDIRRLATWLGFMFEGDAPLDIISHQVYERLATFSVKAAQSHRPGVLLSIDGTDSEDILTFLPKPDLRTQFNWLITSRHEDMWVNYFSNLSFQSLRLQSFSPIEALDYLREALTAKVQSKHDCTDEHLLALANNLGCLPLALSLAAAYLNKNVRFKSVTEYSKNTQDYLKQFAGMLTTNIHGYEHTILITWLIGLPALLEGSPQAVELLLACSYLSGESISLGLLRAYWGDDTNTDASTFDEVITQVLLLQDYSLICFASEANDIINLHPLLQQVLRRWLDERLLINNVSQKTRKLVSNINGLLMEHGLNQRKVLGKLVGSLKSYGALRTLAMTELQRQKALIPHIKAVLSFRELWLNEFRKLDEAYFRNQLGAVYLVGQGDFLSAMGEFDEALKIVESHYGSEHPEVAFALINLGDACAASGESARQKELLVRALGISERHYGENHLEVAIVLKCLGNSYGALGELKKSKELIERAVKISENHYGKDDVEIAKMQCSLAVASLAFDRTSHSAELLESVLKIFERHYGKEHPETAKVMLSLAEACGASRLSERQVILLVRALNIFKFTCGDNHPTVAVALLQLGDAYGALGDIELKKGFLEEALKIFEFVYGKSHLAVAHTLHDLGNVYGGLGDPALQKELLERALEILKRHFDKKHHMIAMVLKSLGSAYCLLGDTKRQIKVQELALEMLECYFGGNHVLVAEILLSLGEAYGLVGDAIRHKELQERVLLIFKCQHGEDRLMVAAARISLSQAYLVLGEMGSAIKILDGVLPFFEKQYGKKHLFITMPLMALSSTLCDAAEQKRLLERALAISEDHYGKNHPLVAVVLTRLSCACGALGDVSRQKELLLQALDIKKRYYGEDHSRLAITLSLLAFVYHTQLEWSQAIKLFEQALSSGPLSATHCDYGLLLMRQKKFDEALKQYKAAMIEVDVGSFGCHWQRRTLLDTNLETEVTKGGGVFFISPQLFSLYHQVLCYIALNDVNGQESAFDDLQAYIDGQPTDVKLGGRLLDYAKQEMQVLLRPSARP